MLKGVVSVKVQKKIFLWFLRLSLKGKAIVIVSLAVLAIVGNLTAK